MREKLDRLEKLQRLGTAVGAEPEYEAFAEESVPHASSRTHVLAEDTGLEENAPILEHACLLWANRRRLGKALLAGLLAGVVVALLIPPRYESTAQLMPPDSQSASGLAALAALASKSGGGSMGLMAGDLLGVRSSGALFVGILHSRTIQDRIVGRFHLKNVYGDKLDEDARRELAENSGASEDRKTGIITVTVSDRERDRARAMAASYVEELNRLVAELSTSAAHRERVFLEERLVSVKLDLDEATRELGEFSSKNATVDVSAQARAMVEGAATLQGEMIAAEAQRQALETIYTANNVRVRAAQARVNEIRKELEKLGGSEDGPAVEAHAGGDAPYSYPSLRKLPLLGAKYADLYRKAKIQEAVFETLTQQYEIAKVQEAKETPSVKMLDDASLPEHRAFPPRALITGLCGLLAMIGASLFAIAERRWRTIDEGNLRKRFVMEVFHDVNSMMPWAAPNGSRWQAATHRVWTRLGSRGRVDGALEREHGQKQERQP